MKHVKVTKIFELIDAHHPNNKEVGYSKEGEMYTSPKVGERFVLHLLHTDDEWTNYWSTSKVTEIVDDHTFKTLNSIYSIEEL
jgi:hypothetical protein